MREKGLSIIKIAKALKVAKSTVSLWCRDIPLSEKQRRRLHNSESQMRGLLKVVAKRKEDRVKSVKDLFFATQKELGDISDRDFLLAGIALYWGEGSKKDGKLSFVNSDPSAIVFMYKWFQKFLGVSHAEFMPRIFINSLHKSRISEVLNFWSSLLELPIEQFGKVTLLKRESKKRYQNHQSYYGVLALRVSKPASRRQKVLSLIEVLKDSIVGVAQRVRAPHS